MKKRLFCLLLVSVMVFAMIPPVNAATASTNAPYAKIEYGYSSTVTCGTVRYISQVSYDSYFYSAYWPSSTFGYYTGPSVECGTASISMALSYIGINKTPNDILVANNGATYFATGWGGSTYYSYAATNLSGAMDKYINGNGKYSPPVIHIPGYSAAGHYVVVVGKISDGVYQILDPWQRALTKMTVSGSSATYTTYGSTTYDNIDQIHQWYNGSASLDYVSTCTSYASHCQIKASKATVVNTQPCAAGTNGSTTIENPAAGDTYTATKLYKNGSGNYWYQVTTSSGKTGYMFSDHVTYVKELTSDITLSGATAPNGHVAGSGYYIYGTISADYNELTNAALYVHSGFGTSGTKVIGYSDTVSGSSYNLLYSNIDNNTKFGSLTTGNYTYAIYASYKNYYASDATTLASKTGTLTLMAEPFVVISSSVSQSGCSHSYSSTVLTAATCTSKGRQILSCAKCGLISETDIPMADHSYGSWVTTEGSCTTDGSRTHSCTACGHTETETIPGQGHNWKEATCTSPKTCLDCGTTEGNPLSHSYQSVVTPPGCTSAGFTTHTCIHCGDSYTNNVTAARHAYTSTVVQPTCTVAGYTRYTCSVCGDSFISNTTSAKGHSYTSATTNPTCTTDGKTVYTCSACGSSYSETIPSSGHNYVGGKCTACGDVLPVEVVKPTFDVAGVSLSFEDEILYNIYFSVTNPENIVEMGLVTFAEKLADGAIDNAIDVIPGYVTDGTEYMVQSGGIAAKNMGDALWFKVYAKLSDGSYAYSDVAGYHAVLYAKNMLGKASTSEKMKALIVAMLNYGTEAQLYFGYKTDELMNSFLTDEQKALVDSYDESMVAEVVSANSAQTAAFPKTSGTFGVSTSVSFDGAFSVNYYFTAKKSVDNGMKLYYWDAATYNSGVALTKENATQVTEMVANGSEYWAQVSGIAAKEIDQTIYVAAVYESEGVEYTSGVTAYSLGHYCKTTAAKETSAMKDFAAATAVYGYYAKQFFAK